jgi:hypothetical protein
LSRHESALGDRAAAVDAMERAFVAREPLFLFVSPACEPTFDLLKGESRYRAVMQRHGARVCAVREVADSFSANRRRGRASSTLSATW